MSRSLPVTLAALALCGCQSLSRVDYLHLFSREGWQRPADVIEALGLKAGDRVADIGAGDGYFTFRFAEAVGPSGRVYAVEVDPERIASLRESARERGHANVVVVAAELDDPLLPDGEIDLGFVCNAYHHIDGQVAYFDRLRRDLATGGRLAILEVGDRALVKLVVPSGHFTPRERLLGEMAEARYRRVASHDFLPLQSFEVFAALGD